MNIYRKLLVYSKSKDYRYIFNKIATNKYDLLVIKDMWKLLNEGIISKAMLRLLLLNCNSHNVDYIFIDNRKELLAKGIEGLMSDEV